MTEKSRPVAVGNEPTWAAHKPTTRNAADVAKDVPDDAFVGTLVFHTQGKESGMLGDVLQDLAVVEQHLLFFLELSCDATQRDRARIV